jgi:hypothetical protein
MKVLISILITLLVCIGAWRIYDHWRTVQAQQEAGLRRDETVPLRAEEIPGLPYQLEPKLSEARQRGAKTYKQFIDTWKGSPEVKDPRLAWIELDYVTMISSTDPLEAKRIFLDVKKRIKTNSVIYPRIRSLSKTYE